MAGAQNYSENTSMNFNANKKNDRPQLSGGIIAGAVGILAGLQFLAVGYGAGLFLAMAIGLAVLLSKAKSSIHGEAVITNLMLTGIMFTIYYFVTHVLFQLLVSLWGPVLGS